MRFSLIERNQLVVLGWSERYAAPWGRRRIFVCLFENKIDSRTPNSDSIKCAWVCTHSIRCVFNARPTPKHHPLQTEAQTRPFTSHTLNPTGFSRFGWHTTYTTKIRTVKLYALSSAQFRSAKTTSDTLRLAHGRRFNAENVQMWTLG